MPYLLVWPFSLLLILGQCSDIFPLPQTASSLWSWEDYSNHTGRGRRRDQTQAFVYKFWLFYSIKPRDLLHLFCSSLSLCVFFQILCLSLSYHWIAVFCNSVVWFFWLVGSWELIFGTDDVEEHCWVLEGGGGKNTRISAVLFDGDSWSLHRPQAWCWYSSRSMV